MAKNVSIVGDLNGIKGDPFTNICVSNVTVEMAEAKKKEKKLPWSCVDVAGVSSRVTPPACDALPEKKVDCAYPADTLPIDVVELKQCYV